jgi:hypothetical protein
MSLYSVVSSNQAPRGLWERSQRLLKSGYLQDLLALG